jgi:hypothetical protein
MQNTRVPNTDRPSQESVADPDSSWLRGAGRRSPSRWAGDADVGLSVRVGAVDGSGQRTAQIPLPSFSHSCGEADHRVSPAAGSDRAGRESIGTPTANPLRREADPDRCEPNDREVTLMTTGPGGDAPVGVTLGPTLSPEDVAQGLGTSPWWVREQARAGRVHHLRLGKGRIRFLPEHVRELLVLCTVEVSELATTSVPTSSAPNSLGALGGTARSQRAHGVSGSSSS